MGGWISETVKSKSDQLNADDLVAGPITVTVLKVERGTDEQPAIIHIDGGHQPFKPCKTVRRLLIFCWGDDQDTWVGRQMTLYRDPDVRWAGEAAGGIRVCNVSHITDTKTVKLSESRTKRKTYTVQPIEQQTQPTTAERVGRAVAAYTACDTAKRLEELDAHIDALAAEATKAQKAELAAARDAAIERVKTN